MENRVTIFSNGVADLTRTVEVLRDRPTDVTLQVRRTDLGDVLASLAVFGDVTLSEPPRYQPAADSTDDFNFPLGDTIEQLAVRLAGTGVVIRRGDEEIVGLLAGLASLTESVGGASYVVPHVVVSTADGLVRVPVRDIARLRFLDDDVRRRLDSALERNLRSVRPDLVSVTFSLTTEADTATAAVRFTIPAAAWKIAYRLRKSGDDPFRLAAFAVVDNTTAEDWRDVRLQVVTGEPVTFSTDLAEARTPKRSHVAVAPEQAPPPTEVSQSVDSMIQEFSETQIDYSAKERSVTFHAFEAPAARIESSDVIDADAYCVFEAARPITLAAGTSALVPLFETAVGEAEVVLHYDERAVRNRPYRAVRLKNTLGHALGRGMCTVSEDDRYAGACVLPDCQPGEERLLPHALEPAVAVVRDAPAEQREIVGFKLAEGAGVARHRVVRTVVYRIRNVRDRSFPFQLDHEPRNASVDVAFLVKCDDREQPAVAERTTSGRRVRFDLPAAASVTVTVTEIVVEQSRLNLLPITERGRDPFPWLRSFEMIRTGPLASDPGIRRCFDLRHQIDIAVRDSKSLKDEADRLKQRQARLRDNLQAVGRDDHAARWRSELAKCEDRIVEIEETALSAVERQADALRGELDAAMRSLAAEWELTT